MPNRLAAEVFGRPIAMSAELMEFAFTLDGDRVAIVAAAPRPGAPADITKVELDVRLDLYRTDGSSLAAGRLRTLTIYSDPALGADTVPARDQLLAYVATLSQEAATWSAGLDERPLYLQLQGA